MLILLSAIHYSNITFLCSVIYPEVDIGTNLHLQWLNSSNYTLHSYTGLNNYTEHTLNYTISNVKLSDAGQYTCSYYVTTPHSYIIASNDIRKQITANIKSK